MLPLKNNTILITRAETQVADFNKKLQQLGANTITLPLIKTTAINRNELTNSISNHYDWIIFTSANAVSYFFETINPNAIKSKIAVVGKNTAQPITNLGLKVNFIPSEFTAKNLANELPVSPNEKIFIPRSALAKNDIVDILENRSCIVDTLSIYDNEPILYSKEELSKVFNQKIDYITFTSGSTVSSFVALGTKLYKEKIICIGPETAKTAKQFNMNIAATASPHTIDGMIEAILLLNQKSLTD